MRNPFTQEYSPIREIYQRSRSKSRENMHPIRHHSSSYREYQVNLIQRALRHNHIISKQYQSDHRRQLNRQRMQQKYYGIESQRYDSSSNAHFREATSTSNNQINSFYMNKQNEAQKVVKLNKPRKESSSSYIQTMVKVGNSQNNPSSFRKPMSYESHYLLNQPYPQGQTVAQIKSSRKLEGSTKSQVSGDRRCSIASQLSQLQIMYRQDGGKGSQKGKVDQIREEYFIKSSNNFKKKEKRKYYQ